MDRASVSIFESIWYREPPAYLATSLSETSNSWGQKDSGPLLGNMFRVLDWFASLNFACIVCNYPFLKFDRLQSILFWTAIPTESSFNRLHHCEHNILTPRLTYHLNADGQAFCGLPGTHHSRRPSRQVVCGHMGPHPIAVSLLQTTVGKCRAARIGSVEWKQGNKKRPTVYGQPFSR